MPPIRARSLLARLLSSVPLILASGIARADDLAPPPWRFQTGSTVQHWEFSTPNLGPPDGLPFFNPNGTPFFSFIDPGNTLWLPSAGSRNGIWQISNIAGHSNQLWFDVPNYNMPELEKIYYVQLTWLSPIPTLVFGASVNVGGTIFPLSVVSNQSLPEGWFHTVLSVRLPGCPDRERLIVEMLAQHQGETALIDQVVFDTLCVPEPSGLAFAGLGAAAWIAARRRSRRVPCALSVEPELVKKS